MAYRGSHHRRYGPYPSQSRGRRDWDDSFPRGNPYQFNTSHGNFSWLDGRSKSGPTDKDIEILRSIKAKPTSRALECSPEEAFTLAQEALENVRKRIHCINSSRADVKSQSKYLLPFRVFNELDKEFFRSMLKGNVSLGWTPLAWGVLSLTKCAGQNDNPRTRIELSPLLHLHGTRLDIFAALIHQMVHAYYLQCCGHRESAHSGDGHDLGHEQQFHALLRCIAKHCDPLRDILMASLWVPRLRRDSVSVQRYCSRGSSNGAAPGTCSCYSHGARFNEVDIRDWRNIALAKAKSLQEARESSETGVGKDDKGFPRSVYRITEEGVEEPPTSFGSWGHPREAYVLLQFDERHYPVARTGVKDLSALTSSPYFKDKHYLQLPQGTSHEDFLTLYFFLSDRGYPPSMKDLSKDASSTGIGQQGPPIIKAYDSISPKQMMPLIAAFQLGAELRYKPLRDHALKGLATLPSTAEDPIEALEKIFLAPSTSQQSATPIATASPDSQLRDWVIRWLQVALPAADWGQYGAIFKTNLSVVRCHPNWSKRFEQLKAKSSAVGEVETMVERQLTFRYFDNNEIMKEIGSPEFGYLSHGQQPLHVPQQFPVPKEAMPVQRSDNRPMGYRGTGDVFDMSNLCKFLPSFGDHQGLHEQLGRPGPSFFVPEQWHAAAAGHQQQQQQQQQRLQQQGLRGVGNLSDPLYPYQLLELWKSGAVNGRPAN